MKKYFIPSIAAFALALSFVSCQKENITAPAAGNASLSAAAAADAAAAAAPYLPSPAVQYGAFILAPDIITGTAFQLSVADQLGVSCLRTRTLVPSTSANTVPLLTSTYKVLLNFSSNYQGTPLPFITNLTQYKTDLKNTLSTFTVMPAVAVIENEESNLKYYSGSAQQYLTQLTTALDVMHSYGVKTANGGITCTGLCYLVYQDYMKQGMTAQAKDFQQRTHLAVKDPVTQNRGAFVDTLLQGYAKSSLDYVNFHWKGASPDSKSLGEVIAYLKKATGKTIINNELGQLDTDPATLLSHVQECTNDGLAYIVWYSPSDTLTRGTPLQYTDASLTPNGIAYQNYLAK